MKLNKLAKYLIITFLISWTFWGLLIVLINNGVTTYSDAFGFILFGVGGLSPTIAAVIVQKTDNSKAILTFIFSRKHRSAPYLLFFCGLITATLYLSSCELYKDMALYLFPLYFLMMIAMGGLEELGWRGIMQPALEKSMPFPVAVLLTGITWAVWHLPLWFVEGSGQQAIPFILFAVYVLVLSFAMAAIHKKTKCVFYSCLFHALCNTLTAYIVININLILALGGCAIIVASLLIWWVDKRKTVALTE